MYTQSRLIKDVQTYIRMYKLQDMENIINSNKKFTVGQVANMLGIYRGTVINYEKRNIFPDPRRNPINGYREYTEVDIDILKRILEGQTV